MIRNYLPPQDLRVAYQQLVAGAETLLGLKLFWTERALLTLVGTLYRRRLQQLSVLLSDSGLSATAEALREAMLEAMAEGALGGHDLGSWDPVEHGYQTRCSRCDMTSWVGHDGHAL